MKKNPWGQITNVQLDLSFYPVQPFHINLGLPMRICAGRCAGRCSWPVSRKEPRRRGYLGQSSIRWADFILDLWPYFNRACRSAESCSRQGREYGKHPRAPPGAQKQVVNASVSPTPFLWHIHLYSISWLISCTTYSPVCCVLFQFLIYFVVFHTIYLSIIYKQRSRQWIACFLE